MIRTTQSEVITIFEDTTSVIADYQQHNAAFSALTELIGQNNFYLYADGRLRVMHYVGFFQHGNTRIQVLPKVYRSSTEIRTEQNAALDFIYRLLYWSGFISHKALQPQGISASQTDLLELFISLFVNNFIYLFQRKVYRRYEERVESQQFIKGKILFSETIRANPILRHKHIVRLDEYSIDNTLNRIFKALLIQLIARTNSPDNKKKIVQGLTYLDDVDQVPLNAELFQSIRFNRLNTDFQPLFNLAKLFFHNHQPGLTKGTNETLSFLVPLHALFESYVAKLLAHFNDDVYTFHHQKNQLHLLSHGLDIEELELRPDYTLTKFDSDDKKRDAVIAILDAKYKSPFNENGQVDLKESDIYQLCAYALRFDVKNLFLIYPQFLGTKHTNPIIKEYRIHAGTHILKVVAIQIDILEKEFGNVVDLLRTKVYPFLIGE